MKAQLKVLDDRLCPQCGADLEVVAECLRDAECWENRAIAQAMIGSCPGCRQGVAARLRERRSE